VSRDETGTGKQSVRDFCATFARLFERHWTRMNKHEAADVPETD
jgi:hypothetical protein